jgi:hypothetical protein
VKLNRLQSYYSAVETLFEQEIVVTRLERQHAAKYLDEIIPLLGASHTEVVDYLVSVPKRYAEVRARLSNGRTARLADARQFLGWRGYGANPTMLFNCDGQRVVVDTGRRNDLSDTTFIARDGSQVALS